MDKIVITGGQPLVGDIAIGGAKNAALPLMAAALLSEETLTLTNLPVVADIQGMGHLLAELGCGVDMNGDGDGRTVHLDGSSVNNTVAAYDIVRKMRASVLVLGPLLARFGKAPRELAGRLRHWYTTG